jgi:hypothetical protein
MRNYWRMTFFHLSYHLGSCQTLRFGKQNFLNCWRCSIF